MYLFNVNVKITFHFQLRMPNVRFENKPIYNSGSFAFIFCIIKKYCICLHLNFILSLFVGVSERWGFSHLQPIWICNKRQLKFFQVDHRIIKVGQDLQDYQIQPSTEYHHDHKTILQSAIFTNFFNTSRDGESTTSWRILFQCLPLFQWSRSSVWLKRLKPKLLADDTPCNHESILIKNLTFFVNLDKLLIFPWIISETKIHTCVSQFKAILEKNQNKNLRYFLQKIKEIGNYFSVYVDVPGRLFHKGGKLTPWLVFKGPFFTEKFIIRIQRHNTTPNLLRW